MPLRTYYTGLRSAIALIEQAPSRLTVQAALERRHISTSLSRRNVPTWPPSPMPQNPISPSADLSAYSSRSNGKKKSFWSEWAHSASFQAALTTIVGLGMVFGAGVGYLEWYKAHVLHRVSRTRRPREHI
jgi:hypothetical protein